MEYFTVEWKVKLIFSYSDFEKECEEQKEFFVPAY